MHIFFYWIEIYKDGQCSGTSKVMTEDLELGAVISFGVLVEFVRRSCASFYLKRGMYFS